MEACSSCRTLGGEVFIAVGASIIGQQGSPGRSALSDLQPHVLVRLSNPFQGAAPKARISGLENLT